MRIIKLSNRDHDCKTLDHVHSYFREKIRDLHGRFDVKGGTSKKVG
jgi:hypothetical protein